MHYRKYAILTRKAIVLIVNVFKTFDRNRLIIVLLQ